MYYEVYLDVLFVENLWMNAMLLLLTAWADRADANKVRIAAAAVLGSLGACMLTIASAWLSGIGYFLGCIALAAGMIFIAFPGRKHFGFRTFRLYLECFVLNGILRYVEQFHRLGGVWFAVFSSISALFLMAAEYIRKLRRKKSERICSVVLHCGVCRMSVEALYDTGNSLYDPVSGRAVSILDGKLLERLLKESGKENIPRLIPYHTIAQHGILEAYILDEMELSDSNGKRCVKHPVIARMPEEDRQYQLILHCDLLSS